MSKDNPEAGDVWILGDRTVLLVGAVNMGLELANVLLWASKLGAMVDDELKSRLVRRGTYVGNLSDLLSDFAQRIKENIK